MHPLRSYWSSPYHKTDHIDPSDQVDPPYQKSMKLWSLRHVDKVCLNLKVVALYRWWVNTGSVAMNVRLIEHPYHIWVPLRMIWFLILSITPFNPHLDQYYPQSRVEEDYHPFLYVLNLPNRSHVILASLSLTFECLQPEQPSFLDHRFSSLYTCKKEIKTQTKRLDG